MLQLGFISFKQGSYILIEGKSDANRFYIIQSGKVQVAKERAVVEEEGGNVLGPGDFLGVVSCMAQYNQIETAIALTDVVLITVRNDQLAELIEQNTPVAMKIIYSFTKKMRYLDEMLTKITLKRSVETDSSHLFAIGDYYYRLGKFPLAMYAYFHYLKESPKGEFAEKARNNFIAIKSMGIKPPEHMLEPETIEINRSYEGEAMVFCECQTGSELYIIQSGHVKITKIVDNSEVLLAVLKEGDMFGEMALLENKPRSASAIVTAEGCKLLAINRKNFNHMVATQPQLIARLITTLANRIWAMYRQLANTRITDTTQKMYDMLALQMERLRCKPIAGNPRTFNFGAVELANMCGISKDLVEESVYKFLREPIVQCIDDKIAITDELELMKQVDYFKKMHNLEHARQQLRNRNTHY